MKKKFILILTVLLMLSLAVFLVACDKQEADLQAPANLRQERFTVLWDEVDGATEYTVFIDGREYITTTECFINLNNLTAGTYQVAVIAIGNKIVSYESKLNVTVIEILQTGYDEFGFYYALLKDRSGYEISMGIANLSETVTLPDYFCDLPVKKLADWAFCSPNSVPFYGTKCNLITTRIILPAHLEKIGVSSLGSMLVLEEVVIPDNVTEIGNSAFYCDYRLKHVTLPKALKTIGSRAFKDTSLDELILPDGLEKIDYEAFYHDTVKASPALLETIIIPDSVKYIGDNAFKGLKNLRNIFMSKNIQTIEHDVFTGTLWYELQPDGEIYLGDVLYGYKGEMPENYVLTVPANVKRIAGGAFMHQNNLQKIIIPDGVKLIGELIFMGCTGLTEITLPSDLTDLPAQTFIGCTSLAEIIIPISLKTMGMHPFYGANLTIYYEGTLSQWEELINQHPGKIPQTYSVYVYSAERPAAAGSYWHYVNGEAVIWE